MALCCFAYQNVKGCDFYCEEHTDTMDLLYVFNYIYSLGNVGKRSLDLDYVASCVNLWLDWQHDRDSEICDILIADSDFQIKWNISSSMKLSVWWIDQWIIYWLYVCTEEAVFF